MARYAPAPMSARTSDPALRMRRQSISVTTLVRARDQLDRFGPDAALDPGAKNAVQRCLRITEGEQVVIVTHDESAPIAAALMRAARGAGAQVTAVVTSLEEASSERFVDRLIAELAPAHASFLVATLDGLPIELRRRVADVEGSARRHGHMIGITRAMMEQAMRADCDEVQRLTDRVMQRMRPGAQVEVRAPGGTELRLTLDPSCRACGASGVLTSPGWTNLPGGEVFAVPSTVDGVVVPDAGAWMPEGAELPLAQRLTLTIERGVVVRVDGPSEPAARLTAVLDAHPGARRVGQLGVGTNTGVLAPIGALLQDLKLPGVHLTLGHTCPELTGARFDAPVEIPLMVRRASLTIDGEPVLTSGKYPPSLRV